MLVCQSCNHIMLGQPVLCEACGRLMEVPEAEKTLIIENGDLRLMPKPQKVWRSAEVGTGCAIELALGAETRRVELAPDSVVNLGRSDPDSTDVPDVDLADLAAFESGVSRLHAALALENGMLVVKDLGSTNGTFVNGQRVTGDNRRVVRDRDVLRLGKLSVLVRLLPAG